MKRVFGLFEVIFDYFYLIVAFLLGLYLLSTSTGNPTRLMAAVMAFVLVGGDAFHLLPRIKVILSKNEEKYRDALGVGKQITSITMTVFYLILWEIGQRELNMPLSYLSVVVYGLALIRMGLCLFPQNEWKKRYPSVKWAIARNVPFFLLGCIISFWFYINQNETLAWLWLAILLSFAFYLPVVLWANKNPKVGMMMFPKTIVYLWMLAICLGL